MDDRIQLLHLLQPDSGRRLRIEVPTVFGRSNCFYHYRQEVRFSDEEAVRLARLDYVEITGDDFISRTHGVLHPGPDGPTIQDLNSKNGTRVNGRGIETTPGHVGPGRKLVSGDVLRVGSLEFVVECDSAGTKSLIGSLARDRHALLAPAGRPEVSGLAAFLAEHKRFQVAQLGGWEELARTLAQLRPRLSPLGILVLVLEATPAGDHLLVNGQRVPALALVQALSGLPGSKVVALQAQGDPAACERLFADLAYQDSLLLTSTVPTLSGLDIDLEPDLGTAPKEQVRRAARGDRVASALHAIQDGLDALLRPDTNVLDVDWVQGYEGALRLVTGSRLHQDYEVELSYRTDDTEPSSFRVRHHFETSRAPKSDDSANESWRAPGSDS